MEIENENPFEFNENERYVACVGENGGTDDEGIMLGFRDSVYVLIDNIINGYGTEDELIYPIVYCCRHSIELSLKVVINNISKIEHLKKIKIDAVSRTKILNSHDIKELDTLILMIVKIDSRINDIYVKISPLISDYFFDIKGDAFKYSLSTEGKPILSTYKITSISLSLLQEKYRLIMQLFSRLISESNYLVTEYSLDVFTNNLSRNDLEVISKSLPLREEWENSNFDTIKCEIKTKYCITGKELSKALDIIQYHQLFSTNIGLEQKIGNISDEEIHIYANYVKVLCAYNKSKVHRDEHGFSLLENIQKRQKLKTNMGEGLSRQLLILLASFCYVGKQFEFFVENFDYVLNNYAENPNLTLDYLLSKVIDIECVLKGMQACGQLTYYQKLRKIVLNENKSSDA